MDVKEKIFELRRMAIVFLLFAFSVGAAAQTIAISGKVQDASGESLPGVSVQIVGNNETGTITDVNGAFSLNVPGAESVLRFSYVGYLPQDIKVGKQRIINVLLNEDTKALDEVVVVGYGVQKKSDVTGALSVVSTQELNTKPVSNAFEALQGKVAGVDITSSQRPGELGIVRIRGMRSLSANSDPLYVVDGAVLSASGIETLNPQDIESITVLKDASSTAIYGSRGANGVVLVTTKRGKDGTFKLNYSGSVTFEKIHDLQPSMNVDEYTTWRRWAYYNANPTNYNPGNQPDEAQDKLIFVTDPTSLNNLMKGWAGGTWDPSKVTNTNWTDFVTQTGITQTHTISANGGTDRMKSYISFGYLDNEGTQRGQSYKRYNATISTDITATPWFTMGGSVNAAWSNQDYGFSRSGQSTNSGPTEIFNAAKLIPNFALPYDDNGEIITAPGGGAFTVIDEWNKSTEKRQTLRTLGNFYGNFNFGKMWKTLDGLNYKMSLGTDYRYYRMGRYLDQTSAVRQGAASQASWNSDRRLSWIWDDIISYKKTIDIHKFDITLIHEASKNDREIASMSEENVPKPSYLWNNMGAVSPTDPNSKLSVGTDLLQSQLISWGYRVNYSLMDKYLLTVSGRRDGSSVLAEGHYWAFFPSAALAWRIDQESFMQGLSWLQALKLRLGLGRTGTAAVQPYSILGNISSSYVPFGGQPDAQFYYTNDSFYNSASYNDMANPLLGWEKTTQWNFGLDFNVLKGRIGGSIDYYASKTNDIIMRMKIPTITAYPYTYANVGKTKNKGVDVSLRFVPVEIHDFKWTSVVNTSWNKDEIVELAYGKNDMVDNNWFIGQPIAVYYGIQSNGLWQVSDAAEMDKFNANGQRFEAGLVKPVDQNNDYYITADKDRVILGNKLPKWTLGWTNTFNYKDFELNIELFGRFGFMVYTGGELQGGTGNQREINYWTPDNPNAEWQKPVYSPAAGSTRDDYVNLLGYKNASYLKLRNISLGYFLPSKICRSAGISNLKVYAQLRNLGNIYSTIKYLDLDLGTSVSSNVIDNAGVSFYNRGITFGIDASF